MTLSTVWCELYTNSQGQHARIAMVNDASQLTSSKNSDYNDNDFALIMFDVACKLGVTSNDWVELMKYYQQAL